MSDESRITLEEDGSFVVENPPPLFGSDGERIETKAKAPLCRCGLSDNKPFCDGSHHDAEWKDD